MPFTSISPANFNELRLFSQLILLLAGTISLFFGRFFLSSLHQFVRSRVRELTTERHQQKNNTPTMGGLFIIAAILASVGLVKIYYANDNFSALIPLIFSLCLFGLLGLWDDVQKIYKRFGISAKAKFIPQWILALITAWIIVNVAGISTDLYIPCFGYTLSLGNWYYLWAAFVIVACSNAVNITDGLDGLAASVLLVNMIAFGAIALFVSHSIVLYTFALITIGSLIGFLWYNSHPARVFMGDVGSLSLGATYATFALMTKMELLIPLIGIVFFIEELSVMMQVAWYKRYKIRLFKMAPLHHHFELSGWDEVSIVIFFVGISAVMALICLGLYLLIGF